MADQLGMRSVSRERTVYPVPIKAAILDDLCSRFLINIDPKEKSDPIKLCYHIELAHWFYLDFMRPEDSALPGCSMKEFIATVFKHVPSLSITGLSVHRMMEEYKTSKNRRPVCGGIILDQSLEKCLLVQGYVSTSSWGFPKGKQEDGEKDIDAAIREVYEEIGLDVRNKINKDWFIERTVLGRSNKMYIIPHIPEETMFTTRTRKEIGKIEWFDISSLPQHSKDNTTRAKLGKTPNHFYLVFPFIKPLRDWIAKNNSSRSKTPTSRTSYSVSPKRTAKRRSATKPISATPPGQELVPVVKQLFAASQGSPKKQQSSTPRRSKSGDTRKQLPKGHHPSRVVSASPLLPHRVHTDDNVSSAVTSEKGFLSIFSFQAPAFKDFKFNRNAISMSM